MEIIYYTISINNGLYFTAGICSYFTMEILKYILVVCLLCSCTLFKSKKSGLQRSDSVLANMEELHADVQGTTTTLNELETALDEVIRSGQTDVKTAFTEYSERVDNLESKVKEMEEHASGLNESTADYLENWEKEQNAIESERLQDISKERRNELSMAFSEIEHTSDFAIQNLQTFVKKNKELRDFLGNDLTATGVNSVTPLARELLQDCNQNRDQLNDMEEALSDAIAEMARRGN